VPASTLRTRPAQHADDLASHPVPLVGQASEPLGLDPLGADGDAADAAAFQGGLDACREDVAGVDVLGVEEDIEAILQALQQPPGPAGVGAAVADEDVAHPSSARPFQRD
jgi:hypothetical protein